MVRAYLAPLGQRGAALAARLGAARGKRAARGQVGQVGRVTAGFEVGFPAEVVAGSGAARRSNWV